jgi:hypothetical protein
MSTIEEERRELWEGLLDGMNAADDPACAAACRRLLRHLAATNLPARFLQRCSPAVECR